MHLGINRANTMLKRQLVVSSPHIVRIYLLCWRRRYPIKVMVAANTVT